MTDTTALDALIQAVEAGEPNRNDGTLYRLFGDNWVHAWDVIDRGSLDAAKALHEALLPGWGWTVSADGASVYGDDPKVYDGDDARSPARAWLLAILKAYRASL